MHPAALLPSSFLIRKAVKQEECQFSKMLTHELFCNLMGFGDMIRREAAKTAHLDRHCRVFIQGYETVAAGLSLRCTTEKYLFGVGWYYA
jgi:hypothetical protein